MGHVNNSRRIYECQKNGKHSYFRLQKFAKHARGFGSIINCLRESYLVRREFQKSLKFLKNDSSIFGRLRQTIEDASEPLRMFGERLEPKIRMLDFAIFWTFASFANRLRAPWKPHFTCLSLPCEFKLYDNMWSLG